MAHQAPTDWESLRTKTSSELTTLGFGLWENEEHPLMLIPYAWHKNIPNGFEVESIFGNKVICKQGAEPGDEGYVDDDYRGGMLAFGFRVTRG